MEAFLFILGYAAYLLLGYILLGIVIWQLKKTNSYLREIRDSLKSNIK